MRVAVKEGRGTGGGGGGVEGIYQKPGKNSIQFNKISNLTSNKISLKNAMKLGFFFLRSLTIWLYVQRGRAGGRGADPPSGGCFLLGKLGPKLDQKCKL